MRRPQLWATATVVLAVTMAACSSGSQPSSTAASPGGSGSAMQTPLAKAEAFSQCMRSHGVSNWPDPVQTPSGRYGFRTIGVDPNSAAFQSAQQACTALYPDAFSGPQLTPAQQQAWLDWAKCIRSHGVPDFPDPTFSGSQVHDSGGGSSSPQLQSAMDACKSQMPSSGGLGG
jgi:hypothetical protein